jgi:hypothetical protein
MTNYSRQRFWLEIVMATATGVLFVLTLVWRNWMETVFKVDPDHHSGSLERWIVVGLLAVTLVLSALARNEWRKVRTTAA